jgi:4-amino-4-deoxy-L-arabinose transferase-like glycosyltransferase
MFNKIKPYQETWIIFSILLIFLLVRLYINSHVELAPDEAYYWYWSKHLDLSYSDHPPMVAYIMAFFTGIGGNTEFFVRLGGIVFSTIALVLLYQTCITLFPNKKVMAWELLFLFNITLLFAAGSIIQTPDTPMLVFWAAAIFFGSKIVMKESPGYWYLLGIALGLGLLSKYTMILFVPCMFLFILCSPAHRFWLKRKEPYLALLIAFILFSPVIFWNWQHHWISFLYQLQQGLSPKRREILQIFLKILEYLGGQAGVITPLLFFAFVIYSIKGFIISLQQDKKEYLYLALLSLPIILFFALTTALGKVAEANWPAPAYIAGGVLMIHVYHEYFKSRKGHRYFIYSGVVLAMILNIIVHVHLITPFIPIAPNLDPTQQFHGWRALGVEINKYIDNNPGKDGYFLLGDKGTTIAEAVFYTQNRFIGIDFAHPERYIFLKDIDYLRGKDAIIIMHNRNEKALNQYNKYFDSLERIALHDCIFRNEKIDSLSVQIAMGKNYRGNWVPYKQL